MKESDDFLKFVEKKLEKSIDYYQFKNEKLDDFYLSQISFNNLKIQIFILQNKKFVWIKPTDHFAKDLTTLTSNDFLSNT